MSNIKKKETAEKAVSLKDGLITYFKEVRSEWSKITWPERAQVIQETLVVIFVVFFFTVFVYGLDKIFKVLLGLIPGR